MKEKVIELRTRINELIEDDFVSTFKVEVFKSVEFFVIRVTNRDGSSRTDCGFYGSSAHLNFELLGRSVEENKEWIKKLAVAGIAQAFIAKALRVSQTSVSLLLRFMK